MNIDLIAVGRTDSADVESLVGTYSRRLGFYCRFSITYLPDVRGAGGSQNRQRTLEGESIVKQISDGDFVVLLDERGREFRSVEFASWLQGRMNSGLKRLVFVIGGPYGFSEQVYSRADFRISLSRMTFSHQMVRAIFAEQLYRAFAILRNEPYHHE